MSNQIDEYSSAVGSLFICSMSGRYFLKLFIAHWKC